MICVLILSAVPALSDTRKETGTGEMSVTGTQKEMIIYCPEMVKFLLQTPEEWSPVVLYSQLLLKFELSETDGKTLQCLYRGRDGISTAITRPAPSGYKCRAGENIWKFTCEKIEPQIRKRQ